MAYSKLQQVIADFGLGFQTVNQLAANIKATGDSLAFDHGNALPARPASGQGQYNFNLLGLHNGGGVPRAVVKTSLVTTTVGTQSNVFDWRSNNSAVTSVTRFSKGQYFVTVAGVPAFYAQGTIQQTALAQVYLPPSCWCFQNALQGPVGVWVELLSLSAGAFVLTDLPFFLAIYGLPPA